MDLVTGRECGECSVCCVALNVDTKEFQKLPGIPCAHLCAAGCSIHTTRYPVCREYHCGWRYLEFLGDGWRPDRSGVLIDFQIEGIPPSYPKRPGIRFTLVDERAKAVTPVLLDYVARLIAADVPVVLSVPGPPGHFPAGAFLNDALKDAVSKRDFARVEAVFSEALALNSSHRFNPVVHRHGGNSPPST